MAARRSILPTSDIRTTKEVAIANGFVDSLAFWEFRGRRRRRPFCGDFKWWRGSLQESQPGRLPAARTIRQRRKPMLSLSPEVRRILRRSNRKSWFSLGSGQEFDSRRLHSELLREIASCFWLGFSESPILANRSRFPVRAIGVGRCDLPAWRRRSPDRPSQLRYLRLPHIVVLHIAVLHSSSTSAGSVRFGESGRTNRIALARPIDRDYTSGAAHRHRTSAAHVIDFANRKEASPRCELRLAARVGES
jgi:hypothetical protein